MVYDPIVQLKYLINIDKDAEVILRDLFADINFLVGSMKYTNIIAHTKNAEKVEKSLIYDAVCDVDDNRLRGPIYLSFERNNCFNQYAIKYVCVRTEFGLCYFDGLVSRTDEDGDTVLDYHFSFYDYGSRKVVNKLANSGPNEILLPENYEENGILPDLSYRIEGFWNPDLDESPILEGYEEVKENIFSGNNISRKRKPKKLD